MKKGQICEGVIEKIDFPNKGRIQIEDEMVTVKNGMPGQKVRFCLLYTSIRQGFWNRELTCPLERTVLPTGDWICSVK